jgi:hypothetical protein
MRNGLAGDAAGPFRFHAQNMPRAAENEIALGLLQPLGRCP